MTIAIIAATFISWPVMAWFLRTPDPGRGAAPSSDAAHDATTD